jgi:hypothetical protein
VEGSFLVRNHSKSPGDFVLSVCQNGKPQHYVVSAKTGTFFIDDGPRKPALDALITYYIEDPDSPTRLTTPICRPGTSMAMWKKAQSGGGAPPLPTGSKPGDDDFYGHVESGAVDNSVYEPPMPNKSAGISSIKGRATGATAPRAAPAPPPEPAAPPRENFSTSRDGFKSNARVQAIQAAQGAVDAVEIKGRTVVQTDGAGTANEMALQFEKEAVATEKLNIWWLNKKMTKLGQPTVTDLTDSLKDGVKIMQVVEQVSGKRAPKYSKMARMDVQRQDNWVAIMGFLRSLGVQVDDTPSQDPEEVSVALDSLLLFKLDRREHLKLFAKIMVYENKLVDLAAKG